MTTQELTLTADRESQAGTDARTWFEQVIRAHERKVLMVAYRMLGNMEDAQDASQEVFLRLHKHRRRIHRERDPAPWLYRVTMNVCFDLRRRRRELPLPEGFDLAGPDPGIQLEAAARRQLLHEALLELPERQRAAIVLRDIEGLSTREVAEILGTAEATVRSQISTARLRLRELVRRRK